MIRKNLNFAQIQTQIKEIKQIQTQIKENQWRITSYFSFLDMLEWLILRRKHAYTIIWKRRNWIPAIKYHWTYQSAHL